MTVGGGRCLDEEFCSGASETCSSRRMIAGCMPVVQEGVPDSFLFVFLHRELMEKGKFLYADPMTKTIFDMYLRCGGSRRKEIEDKSVISFLVRNDKGSARKNHLGQA